MEDLEMDKHEMWTRRGCGRRRGQDLWWWSERKNL